MQQKLCDIVVWIEPDLALRANVDQQDISSSEICLFVESCYDSLDLSWIFKNIPISSFFFPQS